MPSHLYQTKRNPPRWWDIILAHAMELGVACYSAFIGSVVVLKAQTYEPGTGGVLGHLPLYLIYGIGVFVGAGALVSLFGLLVRRSNIRKELNVEQVGWILLAVGWLSYLYAAIRYADGPSTAVAAGLFIGVGAILRAVALIMLERDLEVIVSAAEGGDTENTGGVPDDAGN